MLVDKRRIPRKIDVEFVSIDYINAYDAFREEIVERPPVNTVSKFLLVERHRTTIEPLENLISQLRISASIDDDTADGCIQDLFLLLFRKILKKFVIKAGHALEFAKRKLVGYEIY